LILRARRAWRDTQLYAGPARASPAQPGAPLIAGIRTYRTVLGVCAHRGELLCCVSVVLRAIDLDFSLGTEMALPDTLRSLLSPEAYPHPVRAVQLVETHISWILLTGDFAYKIKRPVQFAFVDQRTAERRAFLCSEELRLNRRFAADLYLEVCVITSAGSATRLGGSGTVIEHAVKMRQFDRANGLDELLENHAVEPREPESFGRDLARIHATLPAARRGEIWGQPDTVRAAMLRNLQRVHGGGPG
jgi:hypothetical protein